MLRLTNAVQFVLSGASVQKYLREWMGLHTPVDPAASFWVCHRSLRLGLTTKCFYCARSLLRNDLACIECVVYKSAAPCNQGFLGLDGLS
jgi:hypothetical protein